MTEKIKISDLRKFDIVDYLDSNEAIAEYLTEVLAERDWSAFAKAISDAARARGSIEIDTIATTGKKSGENALEEEFEPTFDTIRRVCEALGFRLAVVPRDDKDDT